MRVEICLLVLDDAVVVVTAPLLQRIRTQINERGFGKLAGRAIITFSGFAGDPREVYAIPEARSYWGSLNQQFPELPGLIGVLAEMGFSGPGMHLTLLGEVDEVIGRPAVLFPIPTSWKGRH